AENNKERADIQATKIFSQGLPRHIFNTLNQTETTKEIWENVELLMQGSGLTEQQKKETLFDQYERFWDNGNESIHDYFVRFHKLINDMKITKMEIPNNNDISTVSYVDLYTHLKSYEQHAMKTLSKLNQTSGNVDPLAYINTGECEVIKARMKRYIELEAKCESTMDEFDKYQTIISLHQKVESLQAEARGYRVPIPPRDGYVKRDRAEVVSKAVPYIAIKLMHSDEVAKLVGWLATFAIFYGRCFALEEVYRMKEPFGLTKVKATTDPLALVEVLFSKKPKVLRHPTSSKTSSPSNLATPSTTPSLKAVSLC
ncbi:hypothetical protein Tco_1116300, partial [Tanacetum coccineum]